MASVTNKHDNSKRKKKSGGIRSSILKTGKRQKKCLNPQVAETIIGNVEDINSAIDMCKATNIFKKPIDYSNLDEIRSHCKSIMQKLDTVIKTIDCETSTTDFAMRNFNDASVVNNDTVIVAENEEQNLPTAKLSKSKCRKKKCKITSIDQSVNSEIDDINEVTMPISSPHQIEAIHIDKLPDLFSPLTASNTWELTMLKKMLDDPFSSSSRKQYISSRILEINKSIIDDLLKPFGQSFENEISILEKLWTMSKDRSITPEHTKQVDCILIALREKVIQDLTKDVCSTEYQFEVFDKFLKVLSLPCISESEKTDIIHKCFELKDKFVKDLVNNDRDPVKDEKWLHVLRTALEGPFVSQKCKTKLIHEINVLKKAYYTTQIFNEPVENIKDEKCNVNENIRLGLLMKIKASRTELAEKIMNSVEDVLEFKGTNLNFVVGYGVRNPSFVRCINVWNRQESL